MKRIIHILFFLLGLHACVYAQTFTNKGTEFWAGFGHHLNMEVLAWRPGDSIRLVFDFSAEQAAHVVITMEGTTYREEYDVAANSVLTSKPMPLNPVRGSFYDAMLYTRTSDWPGGTNSEGVFKNKGIHIVSDVPIVAYERMYLKGQGAAAVATLLPVDSWGYHYQCVGARQSFASNGDGVTASAFSYFNVIAKEDDTRIRIMPSVPSRSGLPANVPIDITLQKGEIYQFLAGQTGLGTMYDVTGTTITSQSNSKGECIPFATFVGSSSTLIGCPTGPFGGYLEHLLQQLFPQHAWGKRYLTTPTSIDLNPYVHNPNTFRVMVKDPATVVKRNGVVLTGLSNGIYEFTSNTADVIEADQPVQVAQLVLSEGVCGYAGQGDPDYIIISPIEQAIKQARFYRGKEWSIEYNFLALTIPTAGLTSLKIDGQLNNFTHTYPHPSYPGYTVVVRRWHTKSNTDPRPPMQVTVESDSAFNAISYGLGNGETYGFNAGTYINNLNGLPFIKNQYNTADTANKYTCVNTPVELYVLLRYQPTKLFWQLSKLTGIISPANDETDNAPVLVEQVEIKGQTYYKYKLPGTYKFTKPGIHTIPLYATNSTVEQCDHTELIPYQVEVRSALQTDFDIVYQNCKSSELIQFNGRDKFFDNSSIKRWEWSFMNGTTPGTATGKNVQHLFNVGQHSAQLIAIDANACVADTTKLFSLSTKPVTPVFTVSPAAICEGSTVTFTETNPEAGVKKWYWDFGNKDTITLTNGTPTTHVFKTYDTVTVKHVAKFSDVCYSDTATQQVIIYAKPNLAITYPTGCLPIDGIIQFTSVSKAPDGQAMNPNGYTWSFGDASADASNPNTAAIANPTHKYTTYGTYDIAYRATTEKGCYRDTVIKATFNIRPQFTYSPLSPVCANAAQVSIAKAVVTNGVPGTGIYKGPGVSTSGMFDPANSTPGTRTVWYVFTSTNGCTDSISQTINVLPQPVVTFNATAESCFDEVVTISDQSTAAPNNITAWNWVYGDGTSETRNNNAAFNKKYNKEGTYTIQLSVTSSNGCTNTYTQQVNVNPVPQADFNLPAMVCMPNGEAQFTNLSTISSGSLTYSWNFGDNGTSTQKDPIHTYSTKGSYVVKLDVRSAKGCDTSISKVFDKFNDKPTASFNMNNAAVCQGTAIDFTGNSSTATEWNWSFGDGTSSSTQNPSKTFTSSGDFNVTLTVKNAVGCYSDGSTQPVKVYLQPVISAGPDIAAKEGSIIQFKATANSNALQFNWNPPLGLSDPNSLQPTLRLMEDGVYVLTAIGEHNCTASDEMKVLVQRPVHVPNVFSPNGDGINDTWFLKNILLYPESRIEVFNRYGKKVFSSQGYATPWDGKMNGSPLPVGTYYYIIQLRNGESPLRGSVSIIR